MLQKLTCSRMFDIDFTYSYRLEGTILKQVMHCLLNIHTWLSYCISRQRTRWGRVEYERHSSSHSRNLVINKLESQDQLKYIFILGKVVGSIENSVLNYFSIFPHTRSVRTYCFLPNKNSHDILDTCFLCENNVLVSLIEKNLFVAILLYFSTYTLEPFGISCSCLQQKCTSSSS